MGKKAEITAVPIEQQEELIPCGDDEVKTDAQHMTDIINKVNASPRTLMVPDQEQEAPVIEDQLDTPVVVVAQAKRASRA